MRVGSHIAFTGQYHWHHNISIPMTILVIVVTNYHIAGKFGEELKKSPN